jgi:hypothetical protein
VILEVSVLVLTCRFLHTLSCVSRSCSCSCSKRDDDAIDDGRPGNEDEHGEGPCGPDGDSRYTGDGRRTGDGLVIMSVPFSNSSARAGKEGDKSSTRKSYLFLSPSTSSV